MLWGLSLAVVGGCSQPPATAPTTTSPSSARLELVAQCMRDAGWDVEVTWDGSVKGNYPADQRDRWWATMNDCQDQAKAQYPEPVADEPGMTAAYEAEIENRDCLVKAGYDIPDPPSLQQYMDTFTTSRWTAYAALDAFPELFAHGGAKYRQLLERCWPPTWSE